MDRPSLVHISLAWKCRLLFGLAVIVIMAVALLMPFQRMEMLSDELNYRTARQIGHAVLLRPAVQKRELAVGTETLGDWWPEYAATHQLAAATPTIVPITCADVARDDWPPPADAFARRAVQTMCPASEVESQRVVNEFYLTARDAEDHPEYRYALAIRGTREDAAPNGTLLGVVLVTLPAAALVEQPFWNRVVITAAGGAAGVAAILVFYLITQLLILSPVRKLRRVADQVSAGDLSVRARLATGDEFEALGDAFNRMLEGLHASQNELRTTNKSLDVKLGELAEANVALFEADRLKSEFLTNVTHELRTPLSSIIGFAELLKEAYDRPDGRPAQESTVDAQRLARYAGNILSSGRMLLDIINDLLDLAKIEAGRMEIRHQSVVLPDICESLVDFTRPLSDKKNLQMFIVVAPDTPVLDSDAGKIRQILYNLLSNAIKFSPAGGTVTVSVRRDGDDYVQIAVSDTGPGIAADQLTAVFDKFQQGDGSVTREHSGTGLGLTICRELARVLGGTISVDSRPGQGATFTARLPTCAPDRMDRLQIPLVAPSGSSNAHRRRPRGPVTMNSASNAKRK